MKSIPMPLVWLLAALGSAAPATPVGDTLEVRQKPDRPPNQCLANNQETRKIDDGFSRNDIFHKQVTSNIQCASANACSVSDLTSYTVGYSVSATFTPFSWINGGFSVSESYTTGNSYTCNGNPGDTVCVWTRKEHIAYHAQDYGGTTCNPIKSDVYEFQSPREGSQGFEYYCVYGADNCRNDGDGYWQYDAQL